MDRYDVLVVGGVGIDTIVQVDELRLPGGDSMFVPPVYDYVAHTGNGVALGCQTLGMTTKFIDYLGDDMHGRMVLDTYAERGLDFSHTVSSHGTPRGINLVDREGHRFSFFDRRCSDDLRLPRDFYMSFVELARHAHMSIVGHNQDMYEDLERHGVTTSTDLHDWDGVNPLRLHYALRSDLVFLSAATVGDGAGDLLRHIIDQGRARVAVATEGQKGCHVLERGWDAPRSFPAVRPSRPVVDTNGAGDSFVAAFLHSWFAEAPLEECVLAGSVAGAFASGSEGTHTEFIDPPTLRRLVEEAEHESS